MSYICHTNFVVVYLRKNKQPSRSSTRQSFIRTQKVLDLVILQTRSVDVNWLTDYSATGKSKSNTLHKIRILFPIILNIYIQRSKHQCQSKRRIEKRIGHVT